MNSVDAVADGGEHDEEDDYDDGDDDVALDHAGDESVPGVDYPVVVEGEGMSRQEWEMRGWWTVGGGGGGRKGGLLYTF